MRQPLFFALILVLSSASLDQSPEDQSKVHELNYKLLTDNEVAITHSKTGATKIKTLENQDLRSRNQS